MLAQTYAGTVEIDADLVLGEVELFGYLAVGIAFDVAEAHDVILRRGQLADEMDDRGVRIEDR